jgi:hypothetical protein
LGVSRGHITKLFMAPRGDDGQAGQARFTGNLIRLNADRRAPPGTRRRPSSARHPACPTPG